MRKRTIIYQRKGNNAETFLPELVCMAFTALLAAITLFIHN